MAPLSTAAISHFLHPAHNLHQLTTNTPFLCDGCKVPGDGSRFTCTVCSFDLHDYCAKCPNRLTSTTNHQHPMSLLVHRPQPDHTESCQICHNPIKGLAYVCKDCKFWVHPLCVSGSSGRSQQNTASGTGGAAFAAASVDIGQQIGVGLVTNALYDQIKGDDDKVPSAGTNASGAAGEVPSAPVDSNTVDSNTFGVDEDDGGFFHSLKSGLKSFFESSMEK